MDRLFLDANVLFSAANRADSRLNELWTLPDALLLTSEYAAIEARRNLSSSDQIKRLDDLMQGVEIVMSVLAPLPSGVTLPAKDWPILQAAINGDATHLITGDRRHFVALFGHTISGVQVVTPSGYLSSR